MESDSLVGLFLRKAFLLLPHRGRYYLRAGMRMRTQAHKCPHRCNFFAERLRQCAQRHPTNTLRPQSPLQQPSHIFMVPLGPKLVRSTSCSPRAAHILTAKAARARATSALEFIGFTAHIAQQVKEPPNQKQAELRF